MAEQRVAVIQLVLACKRRSNGHMALVAEYRVEAADAVHPGIFMESTAPKEFSVNGIYGRSGGRRR